MFVSYPWLKMSKWVLAISGDSEAKTLAFQSCVCWDLAIQHFAGAQRRYYVSILVLTAFAACFRGVLVNFPILF